MNDTSSDPVENQVFQTTQIVFENRKRKTRQFVGIFSLLFLIVGVITGVMLGSKNQEIRQRAYEPYESCVSGFPDCIGQNPGTSCASAGTCVLSQLTGNCSCQPPTGPVCDVCLPPDQSCPGGMVPSTDQQCVWATSPIGDYYGKCCVSPSTPTCLGTSTAPACQGNDVNSQCNNFPGTCTQTGTDSSGNINCSCVAYSTSPDTPTPPNNASITTTPPNNPTSPPSTPIPTAPVGMSQGTIRVCKAITVNNQMISDWSTLPETRFRVQFDKKPDLRDVPGENNVPSTYGTKPVDIITFKTATPTNLKMRPNIDNVYADCQDLVINYNDGDRQDITYKIETIEQKDANGQWTTATGWSSPIYNDSVLIKDIDGQLNTTDTVDPSQLDSYDESLFDGSDNQTVINRIRFSDGYIRINNSHNTVTLLIVNNYTSEQIPTPTSITGPVCTNVSLNNLSQTNPETTPGIGDHVTLTCSQVIGANHYEFMMQQPDGSSVTIPASNTLNISQDFTITMAGSYIARCRVCSQKNSESCSAWEDP